MMHNFGNNNRFCIHSFYNFLKEFFSLCFKTIEKLYPFLRFKSRPLKLLLWLFVTSSWDSQLLLVLKKKIQKAKAWPHLKDFDHGKISIQDAWWWKPGVSRLVVFSLFWSEALAYWMPKSRMNEMDNCWIKWFSAISMPRYSSRHNFIFFVPGRKF